MLALVSYAAASGSQPLLVLVLPKPDASAPTPSAPISEASEPEAPPPPDSSGGQEPPRSSSYGQPQPEEYPIQPPETGPNSSETAMSQQSDGAAQPEAEPATPPPEASPQSYEPAPQPPPPPQHQAGSSASRTQGSPSPAAGRRPAMRSSRHSTKRKHRSEHPDPNLPIGQNINKVGNVVATIIHNTSKGQVNQNNNNVAGSNSYRNSVQGTGNTYVHATGGNVVGGIKSAKGVTHVGQSKNGDDNNYKVSNKVGSDNNLSKVIFAAGNTVGKAEQITGSNSIGQNSNNDNGKDTFQNS